MCRRMALPNAHAPAVRRRMALGRTGPCYARRNTGLDCTSVARFVTDPWPG